MHKQICYRKLKDYKYQLMEPYIHETGLKIPKRISTTANWLNMTKSGRLTVKKGYAWDGPSGPTIDTKNFMRGSLVHDALYQMMREKLLPQRMRKAADIMLRDLCRHDGMSHARADYVYHAVRVFGGKAAKPSKKATQVIIKAP
ncbi:MAG: hypothetical protein E2P02_23725 [Acidobacteria bacterium]|nr:MAG: hypothetical protein E2P02_23725 [Acidobacteriota bacterium]